MRFLPAAWLVIAFIAGGCSAAQVAESVDATSASPSATTVDDVTPRPSPTTAASAGQTPPQAATPPAGTFAIGSPVRPTVEGLRVRAAPGTTGELLSTMPLEADGGVVLGPLPADGYDWYLISYTMVDEGRFDGGKGWVAYGPAETPWLAPASPGGVVGGTTSFRGTAGTGPGVVGPVEIGDYYGLSWAAVGEDCPLVVSINDVAVVSTRVDGFAEADVSLGEYPELLGTFDIEVETECSWTLSHGTYQG